MSNSKATFTNPVYKRSFPDPFVLKHRGEYFAYCTGLAPDGRVFGVLRSTDLAHWEELTGAMEPLQQKHPHYWAPEVTYHEGRFYLYYSVGNEELMEIRVAVSDRPDGGFTDAGIRLTSEEFAIDPHVLIDSSGRWFLFYATDFLTHTHIGTGTVVDRMINPFELSRSPRPVTRARYDWQVYDPERKEKGGVRWHTVEGPFVLERKGLYYQMFSGGNWQNDTYGVSFAVSETLDRDSEWDQFSDGTRTLPILRTIPGLITGPGHNSVVRGPNNRELYCVYHRWTEGGRVLAIDRMDFAGPGRIFVIGPTNSQQPLPFRPVYLTPNDEQWRVLSGDWEKKGSTFTSSEKGKCEISYDIGHAGDVNFLIGLRAAGTDGRFGVGLSVGEIGVFSFEIDGRVPLAFVEWPGSGGKRPVDLPPDFDAGSFRELTIDIQGVSVSLSLGYGRIIVTADLPARASNISMFSEDAQVEFGPVQMTLGFEDLFETGGILTRGWDNYSNRGSIELQKGVLQMKGLDEKNASITRNVEAGDHELCINLRMQAVGPNMAKCSFGCGYVWTLTQGPPPHLEADGHELSVPDSYDPGEFYQFRSIRRGNKVDFFVDADHVGTTRAVDGEFVRIMAQNALIELDMVRYTLL